jgi:hypothetical protein
MAIRDRGKACHGLGNDPWSIGRPDGFRRVSSQCILRDGRSRRLFPGFAQCLRGALAALGGRERTMKKRVQKLRLSRETVLHLDGIQSVQGAGRSIVACPQIPDPPDPTNTNPIATGPYYTGCASYSCGYPNGGCPQSGTLYC